MTLVLLKRGRNDPRIWQCNWNPFDTASPNTSARWANKPLTHTHTPIELYNGFNHDKVAIYSVQPSIQPRISPLIQRANSKAKAILFSTFNPVLIFKHTTKNDTEQKSERNSASQPCDSCRLPTTGKSWQSVRIYNCTFQHNPTPWR